MVFLSQISSKKLIVFVVLGILVAFLASLMTSKSLANLVGTEVQERDLDFLFGAIESGPLAIARLQSAAIANQDLKRIMSNPKFQGRGITEAYIHGGENLSFTFASWTNSRQVRKDCLASFERKYEFAESLNVFQVRIIRDECFDIKEKHIAFLYSASASLGIAVVSILLLLLSIWPAASSIRKAEKIFDSKNKSTDQINFTPIKSLVSMALKSIELEKGKVLSDLASQVSHDIRSPLSALNITMSKVHVDVETKAIINNAIKRINDIADNLLRHRMLDEGTNTNLVGHEAFSKLDHHESVNILPIVASLIEEKKTEFKKKNKILISYVADEVTDASAKISEIALTSLLSNLINNAVESISDEGTVSISARIYQSIILITVADNGVGISKDEMAQIGKKGFTSGKENGNGLGIYHAKKSVEDAGGSFVVRSDVSIGTSIEIQLPRVLC